MMFPHLILSVVFTQSGFDKLADWKGNVSWIRSHFANSPLRHMSKGLLLVLTGLEFVGGLLGFIGFGLDLFANATELASTTLEISLVLIGLALVGLMIGQRLAKDYAGAASLVGYCLLFTASFYFFTLMHPLAN